ncbi:hypothetical protein [uncultured Chryseobacterium sp.]|uniref:hypothetical protein n=1 Tax=uncultured Chryseobacterium sp. TaxID=259322 RepID=UPI00258722EE|nr:hypothetical protein [uncultured Chryseobacterium sp.]
MKKILLTAIMLVGLSAFSKAQTTGRVGINTTTPAATLDVVATTTDNTRPDALLVPRMTRSQLYAKDAAYTAAQNGALAFVTTIDGTATTKTANVTAVGFYYYDSVSSTWKNVGGGAVATGMTVRVQTGNTISDADLNNAIIVNTAGSVFNLDALTKTNGKIITFVDNTTSGFSVTGTAGTISPQATLSPTGPGGSLSYICDGAVWYSYNSY